MPGILPHLIAGCTMFIIGRYYFKSYFDGDNKTKELLLLAVTCLSFSIIPDFFLGIYHTTHILPYDMLLPYHVFAHLVFSPIAIIVLLILKYRINTKRGPIWVMGLWSIILHITMDLFISEGGWII